MSDKPRLYSIEPETKTAKAVGEVDFAALGLRERQDIQEWVAAHPDILDDDLLIVTKEFSGFDLTSERADLVAVDKEGSVVVIELKRDDTGSDAHWQAIKYASYFRGASSEAITQLLSDHASIELSEAETQLIRHLEADDLGNLNRRQRIILASHRFAPEVTSAVLWLNDQAATDLITCVQLTPYRDQDTESLYLQATTLLPIADPEDLQVGIGSSPKIPGAQRKRVKKDDAITHFLQAAYQESTERLEPSLIPDKRSRWAGVSGEYRYYYLWYSAPPVNRWKGMSFQIILSGADEPGVTKAIVFFATEPRWAENFGLEEPHLSSFVASLKEVEARLGDRFNLQVKDEDQAVLSLGATVSGESLTGTLREKIVVSLVDLIKDLKPTIDELAAEWNEM